MSHNGARLASAGLGALTAYKLISKVVPEGQARTFTLGMMTGGFAVGVADELGFPVLEPIRFGMATMISLGSKQLEEINKNLPNPKN